MARGGEGVCESLGVFKYRGGYHFHSVFVGMSHFPD